MATIVHFNITAKNPVKISIFYKDLFGWEVKQLPGPESYYLVSTRGLNGRRAIGGGIAKRDRGQRPGFANFIGVKSINRVLAGVTKRGGSVILPKRAVPGFGVLATCMDPEGNIFGMFEERVSKLKAPQKAAKKA